MRSSILWVLILTGCGGGDGFTSGGAPEATGGSDSQDLLGGASSAAAGSPDGLTTGGRSIIEATGGALATGGASAVVCTGPTVTSGCYLTNQVGPGWSCMPDPVACAAEPFCTLRACS